MLLLLIPQGGGAGLDVQLALNDVIYRLGFASATELNSSESYVTGVELFQFADDEAKRLAARCGIFVTFDTSITVNAGTPQYSLPGNHVFTIAAWLIEATSLQILRPTGVGELFALDGNWSNTSGDARRMSFDAGPIGTITLYPNPVNGGTLEQICQEYPSGTLGPSSSTLLLPPILRDLFSYAMLTGARGKESDAAMPEMVDHFKQRLALYEQVCEHLWGPGQ